MNDDFLIAKKLSIDNFFDKEGRVIAYAYSHVAFPFELGFIDLPYGLGINHKWVKFEKMHKD